MRRGEILAKALSYHRSSLGGKFCDFKQVILTSVSLQRFLKEGSKILARGSTGDHTWGAVCSPDLARNCPARGFSKILLRDALSEKAATASLDFRPGREKIQA